MKINGYSVIMFFFYLFHFPTIYLYKNYKLSYMYIAIAIYMVTMVYGKLNPALQVLDSVYQSKSQIQY